MKQQTKTIIKELGVGLAWLTPVFLAVGILLMAVLMGSCTRKVYVPVKQVRTEYKGIDSASLMNYFRSLLDYRMQTERASDSVVEREKETVVLNANGDTVKHDKERNTYMSSKREKELEHKVKEQSDSIKELRARLASVKADSIPVPYPVERPLSKWEQVKMDFGGMFLGGMIAAVVSAVIVWIVKLKRRV